MNRTGLEPGPQGRKFDAFTPHRDLPGRHGSFRHHLDRRRLGRGLSDPAGQMGRRISAGRRDRHHRAADRPAALGAARPAIRDREQARRRQQHRHRIGHQRRAGRLHRAAGQSRELHQRLALRQPEVQRGSRHRAGRGVQSRAERDDGQQECAGQDGRRVHRLCEGQSRQGESRFVGQRHLRASVRRNVHGDVGRQDAARALSRRGAGDHRSARRPGPGDLRQHAFDPPACPCRFGCGRWR